MTLQPLRPILSTLETEPHLLIAYDPDASYPYWACWEANQESGHDISQAPVGRGNTPQEAIDCLYASMAWWCLRRNGKPPLGAPMQDQQREVQGQIDEIG